MLLNQKLEKIEPVLRENGGQQGIIPEVVSRPCCNLLNFIRDEVVLLSLQFPSASAIHTHILTMRPQNCGQTGSRCFRLTFLKVSRFSMAGLDFRSCASSRLRSFSRPAGA